MCDIFWQNSFTIIFVSSISMKIFIDNSQANFRNLLSEDNDLQGEWIVALTKIMFLNQINNVTDTKIGYLKKERYKASLKMTNMKYREHMMKRKKKPQKMNMTKLRNYSSKSIGRLILIVSVIATIPLPNIFQHE